MTNGNPPKITPIGSGSWQGLLAETGASLAEQSIIGGAAAWDSLIGGSRTQASVSTARDAANAIRARFYQKEWDQVRKARIIPIQERMMSDEAEYRDRLSVSPRRVETFVDEEEAQMIGEAFQRQPKERIPGKPTADGKPGKETMAPAPPAPNAAINPGALGAVRTEEVPSIMDPTTGEPVPTSSARALDIMKELSDMYWKRAQNNILEMMDIYGEYASNPYVSQAAQQLMQSVSNTAGQSVTGKTDSQDQQEWWEGRQQFEANMEAQDVGTRTALTGLEETEGRIRAREEFGRAQAADPSFPIRDSIRKKLLMNKPLNRKEAAELSAAVEMQRARETEGLALRKAEGLEVIPRALFRNPQDWQGRLSNMDRSYQNYYDDELANRANELTQRYVELADNPVELEDFLVRGGAPRDVVEAALASEWDDRALMSWIQLKANTKDAKQQANDSAYLKRLPEIARSQPGVADAIREEITEVMIPQLWRGDVIDRETGKPIVMTREMEEQMLADPYVTFFLSTTGREPPRGYQREPETKARLNKIKHRQAMQKVEREEYRTAERAAAREEAEQAARPAGLGVVEPAEALAELPERLQLLLPSEPVEAPRTIGVIEPPQQEQIRFLEQPVYKGVGGLVKGAAELAAETWDKPLYQIIRERFSGRDLGQHFETNEMKKERLAKERIK